MKPDWITLSTDSNLGTQQVNITASENTDSTERTAVLSVKTASNKTAIINITQEPNPDNTPYIQINPDYDYNPPSVQSVGGEMVCMVEFCDSDSLPSTIPGNSKLTWIETVNNYGINFNGMEVAPVSYETGSIDPISLTLNEEVTFDVGDISSLEFIIHLRKYLNGENNPMLPQISFKMKLSADGYKDTEFTVYAYQVNPTWDNQ